MRIKRVRIWTPIEDDELRRLASQGYTSLRAAAKLRRSQKSVQKRARLLNIELRSPVTRAPKIDRMRL